MILRPFEYVSCRSPEEAVSALAEHGDDAVLVAGGTVVVAMMKHDLLRPGVVVGLDRVDAMRAIDVGANRVRVGALATHRAITASAELADALPLLSEACGRVASPVIRAMGTLGGNICYGESASDPGPALLVLDATLHLVGAGGERRVRARDFYRGFYETDRAADEVLTTIEVPRPGPDVRWTYCKWTPRAQEDKPLIGLAATIAAGTDGPLVTMAVGGIDPTPVVLASASAAASGSDLSEAAIDAAADAAADEVDPITDLQGSAEYRRDMVRVWVRRVLLGLRDEELAA
ncbi:MAG: FAD binding domain-containing protein [Acidimicrobiia bacterium]|nr:FAD binding domain-containing protein [Acidimicrobiia bacterium]